MAINIQGLMIIKCFEGFSDKPYRCPAGVYTIGYGHTQNVSIDTPMINIKEAEKLLCNDLMGVEESLGGLVHIALNENQHSALISFVFNCGLQAFARSTLRQLINKGQFEAAADEMLRWVHVKRVRLAGLVKRRAAEHALFSSEMEE